MKVRAVGRPLGWSVGTDLAAKAAVLVTTLIAVRSLPPSKFGIFVGMSASALMAAALWDFGLSPLLTREVATGYVGIRRALAAVFQLRLKLLPLWLTTFAVGTVVVDRDRTIPLNVIAGFAAASLVFGCHSALLATLRGRLGFRSSGLATAYGRLLTAGLCFIGIGLLGLQRPLEILAWTLCGGEILTLILAARALLSESSGPQHQGHAGRVSITLRAAAPFCANGILATAYNRFDVIILAALASVQQVGYYGPASRIQDALYLMPSAVGIVALPLVAARYAGDGGRERVRRLTQRLIVVGLAVCVPITALVFLLTPLLVRVVLGPSYGGAVKPTQILIWFLPFAAVQAPLLSALAGTGHAGDTTKVFVATFVTAIVLHVLLDGWLGATGAAIASLSRDPVAVVVAVLLARRYGLVGLPRSWGRLPVTPARAEAKL
jgi:O-antigen/teichoic acid export membrane protein